MSDKTYAETKPAAVATGVDCKRCEHEVVQFTFFPNGDAAGVCACPWTSWVFDREGGVYRSELGDSAHAAYATAVYREALEKLHDSVRPHLGSRAGPLVSRALDHAAKILGKDIS